MERDESFAGVSTSREHAAFKRLLVFAVVAASYIAAAKLGLVMGDPVTNVTPVWPATGVSLGCLVAFGWRRMWLPVLVGVALENALDAVLTHSSFSVGDFVGNAAGALLGAWLVERFATGRKFLEHPVCIVRFIVLGAGVAGAVSGACGVFELCLKHIVPWSAYGHEWTPCGACRMSWACCSSFRR